ncbi:MAG: HD domain-containing protein [Desulfobacca sp.]|nr:HD domain-containing protein [Desulfobacca sp.]
MVHQFIKDLRDGDSVQQYFVLKRLESRLTRNGEPYLSLLLGDRSGSLKAKVWSDVLEKYPEPLTAGDYVAVKGRVSSFNDELQISVQAIMTVDRIRQLRKEVKDLDLSLLIPATAYDRDQMWQELLNLAEEHVASPLKELVLALLHRHAETFKVCPAARLYHHAYLGGLLEHTWFLARMAVQATAVYTHLNRSLVVAGVILHDLGKIQEITNPQAPDYSISGQLLGHIILGVEMVRDEARAQNFPDPNLLLQLEHIIVAHHGYQEYGSPVLPKTREALLVYFLDDLDAKLKMMDQHLEVDRGDRDFTSYNRLLQRELYKAIEHPETISPIVSPADD